MTRLGLLHIEHIGRAAGDEHGKQAGQERGGYQRVGDHDHQQLPLAARQTRRLRDKRNAQKQQHAQDDGTGANNTGIAVSAHGGQEAAVGKQFFQFKANACHSSITSR